MDKKYIKPAIEAVLIQGESLLAEYSTNVSSASVVSDDVEWDAKGNSYDEWDD